jgi:hypothetical protein
LMFYQSLDFTPPALDAAGESPLPSRGDSGPGSSRASPDYPWQLRDTSASPSSKTSLEAPYATLQGEEVRSLVRLKNALLKRKGSGPTVPAAACGSYAQWCRSIRSC